MKRVSVNVDLTVNVYLTYLTCKCKCIELINKGVCDKGFVWNPSNCEYECYKFCDFSEYLDYKNCNCKKRLVDKLAKECTRNIEEIGYLK